jgi:hypothetical protein
MIRSEIARPSAGTPESRQITSTALLSSSPPRASCSAICTSACALASPRSSQLPSIAWVAQWALPKRIVALAGPFCAWSVSRMLSRISGISRTGSPSSSTRLTKMMTSRARMLAIIRISAMSTVDSA